MRGCVGMRGWVGMRGDEGRRRAKETEETGGSTGGTQRGKKRKTRRYIRARTKGGHLPAARYRLGRVMVHIYGMGQGGCSTCQRGVERHEFPCPVTEKDPISDVELPVG